MGKMLQFLGRGSAFADENNSAFFVNGSELVLIDFPLSSFMKMRRIGADKLSGVKNADLTVIITHTHGDHAGGVATLIHYAFYIMHRKVTVIAPSDELAADLKYLIERIEGCDPAGYELITADKAERPWLIGVIPTIHTPQLAGRCFGYNLLVEGNNVVYTGDTAVIEPFLPYLTAGTYLYSDSSASGSRVHIGISELLEKVRGLDIHLYLMHLDQPGTIFDIAEGSGALAAPLYK